MTVETPGTTNTPDAPLTRETAAARLAEVKADPQYVKRYLDGGVAEKAEMSRLHQALTNNTTTVLADIDDRSVRERQQVADTWRRFGLPDEIAQQSGPVSKAEYDQAVNLKSQLMRDKEFVRRLYDGDRQAALQWGSLHKILAWPVK
jgi:hypothetical protein